MAKLKAIDFFCGAGGVTKGFLDSGIEVLGGIDIDPKCKETYEKNNLVRFLNIDISDYPLNGLKKEFGITKNDKNLIFVGCSPCQYFSKISTDKNKSIHSKYLLSDFQNFIRHYLPGYIFIENVPGIEKKPGSPLQRFKKFLISKGYFISEGKINARDFKVPQNRLRYILIASRTIKGFSIFDIKKFDEITVKQAIGDLKLFPKIEQGHHDNSEFQHSSATLTNINLTRVKHTPKSGGDKRDWPKHLHLNSSKNLSGHYDVYGRMDWEKPSPTITTRFRSLSTGRFGHPEQDRAISIREGATLQSFPMEYFFYGSCKEQIARMIGNAVPPKLAEQIGSFLNEKNFNKIK